MANTPQWKPCQLRLWLVVPFVAAVAAYGLTVDCFFIADDFGFVMHASVAENWIDAANKTYSKVVNWIRPIVHLSFWFQWPLSQFDAIGYRVFNVVVHGLNSCAVAWLGANLAGSRFAGAIGGIAFALLPIHPEAVTWISGRADLLCTSGVLVSMLAWVRYCSHGGRARHAFVACLGLVFALGSKEMAVVTMLLLCALSFGTYRPSLRKQWTGLACFVAITAGYLLIRVHLLGGLGGYTEAGDSQQGRIDVAAALRFTGQAAMHVLAPLHRDLFYGKSELVRYLPLAGWSFLALAAFVARARRAASLRLTQLVVLFLISVIPVCNWAVADWYFEGTRYLYLPSVFSCIVLGMFAQYASGCARKRSIVLRRCIPVGGLLLILPFWVFQLTYINHLWSRAANISQQMIDALPRPNGDWPLIATGMTDNYHGALVLRNGVGIAAEIYRGWNSRSREVSPKDWQEARLRILDSDTEAQMYLRWLASQGRWTSATYDALPEEGSVIGGG